jgi:hypothetical protein
VLEVGDDGRIGAWQRVSDHWIVHGSASDGSHRRI